MSPGQDIQKINMLLKKKSVYTQSVMTEGMGGAHKSRWEKKVVKIFLQFGANRILKINHIIHIHTYKRKTRKNIPKHYGFNNGDFLVVGLQVFLIFLTHIEQ
jgi:hypothetical protein